MASTCDYCLEVGEYYGGGMFCTCYEVSTIAHEPEPELPPSPPQPPQPPRPLLDIMDENRLKHAWKVRRRELETEKMRWYVDTVADMILGDKTGESIMEELFATIGRAKSQEHLHIKLFSYKAGWITDLAKRATPSEENPSYFLEDYVDLHLNTRVARASVHHLLRTTNLLDAVLKRISSSNNFVIRRHMGPVTEHDGYKTAEPELWLEYWPKGVTFARRVQCEIW
jgi:hypothetical protein